MSDKIRAVVVDPNVLGRLSFQDVDAPIPAANEALVRVASISLNRGEVRRATTAEAGWRPGWDLAGTIETPAADGSGPPQGARVVGLRRFGAWGELVSVPTNAIAEIPPSVSFAQAATLKESLWVDRDINAGINIKRVGLGLFPTIKRRRGNQVVTESTTNSTSKEVLETLKMCQKPTPTRSRSVPEG